MVLADDLANHHIGLVVILGDADHMLQKQGHLVEHRRVAYLLLVSGVLLGSARLRSGEGGFGFPDRFVDLAAFRRRRVGITHFGPEAVQLVLSLDQFRVTLGGFLSQILSFSTLDENIEEQGML